MIPDTISSERKPHQPSNKFKLRYSNRKKVIQASSRIACRLLISRLWLDGLIFCSFFILDIKLKRLNYSRAIQITLLSQVFTIRLTLLNKHKPCRYHWDMLLLSRSYPVVALYVYTLLLQSLLFSPFSLMDCCDPNTTLMHNLLTISLYLNHHRKIYQCFIT